MLYLFSLCVCICIYLPSYNIQGLSYTRVVLSLYLYLSNVSFDCCTFFAIITFLQSISRIYTSLGKTVLFCHSSNFPSVPSNFQLLLFFPILDLFLSVSSKLFINLYIVIKSPISLLSSNVCVFVFNFC